MQVSYPGRRRLHIAIRLCRVSFALCFCLVLSGLGGCAAARWDSPAPQRTVSASPSTGAAQITLQQMLNGVFSEWRGTPYQYGGNSLDGIDCSAFSQRAIDAVYGLQLPRTTALQMNSGHSIDLAQVRAGDMVFFKTGPQSHHVGVMMDHVKFMHASTNHGVSLSRLDDGYWQTRLIDIRRIN